jgi:hypothetical protein
VKKDEHGRKCDEEVLSVSFPEKVSDLMDLMAKWDVLYLLAGTLANMMHMHMGTTVGAPVDAPGHTCRRWVCQ